jgi:hypothetical protein
VSEVSLKRHGLRLREGLDCPGGGSHEVAEAAVVTAAAVGAGEATCLKCHERLHLDPRPGDG